MEATQVRCKLTQGGFLDAFIGVIMIHEEAADKSVEDMIRL